MLSNFFRIIYEILVTLFVFAWVRLLRVGVALVAANVAAEIISWVLLSSLEFCNNALHFHLVNRNAGN